MHICMLLLAKYREVNQPITGVDLQAITQINALRDAGHQVTVIAKKRTSQSKFHETIDGIEVYRIGPSGLYWLWTTLILLRKRRQLDVIHMLGQHVTTFISIGLGHLFHIPTVLKIPISYKHFSPIQFIKILHFKLENLISRQASAYLAISEEIASQLVAEGFYPERIIRFPNGVDMERFFTATEKNPLRGQLGLPVDKKIVLYSGRLVNRKGFDLILAAWPQIYVACPDAHLVVVGGGPEDSKAALEKLAVETGQTTMTCVGPVSNVASYLAASDIYLFPSRREGLPNALLEAMSCGCACIASEIGGCTDLIDPGKTGLLFPSGDAQAMTEIAIHLLSDESLIKTLGKSAHNLIAAEYELHSVIERLIKLYCSLKVKSSENLNV